MPRRPVSADTLLARTERLSNGCMVWTGACKPDGYAQASIGGKMFYVHRLSYEWNKGPIPEGLQIDHLCRNRRCINPEHLEAVSGVENNRRSNSLSANNSRKTICPKGHSLEGDNIQIGRRPSGRTYRMCRTCRNAAWRAWHHRKKAA